jgi:hypothetical protein
LPYKPFILAVLATLLSLFACNNKTKKNGIALASYNGKTLYLTDIKDQLNVLGNKEDSIARQNALVQSWITQAVLLDNAVKNLGDSNQVFKQLIEDYENSLYIYHYQQSLSKTLVDTTLNDSLLYSYYIQNKQNFELKRDIVKIWYAKFQISHDMSEDFSTNFGSSEKSSELFIKEYCDRFAENHFVSSEDWLYFDEIRKEIPLDPSYAPSSFLRSKKVRQFEDEEYVYWLKIVDYKVKNKISPFELVKDEIKQMLLNQRKVKALNNNQKKLVQRALKNGDAKIY